MGKGLMAYRPPTHHINNVPVNTYNIYYPATALFISNYVQKLSAVFAI